MANPWELDDVYKPTNPWEKDEEEEQKGPVDYDVRRSAEQLIPSAKQYGEDLWHAATNPKQTASVIGTLAEGTAEKGLRNVQEMKTGEEYEKGASEQAPEMVWQGVKDRYGSVDNFKRTLMDDPYGVLVDVASFGTLGSFSKLGKAARSAEMINAASQLGRHAMAMIPDSVMTKLYASALKLPTTSPVRQRIVNTALEHGILPNLKGVLKMDDLISAHESKLNKLVDEATESGQMIPREALQAHMDELFDSKGGLKAEGIEDQMRVYNVFARAMNNMGDKRSFTPREVQDFKQDLYKKIYTRKTSSDSKVRQGVKVESQQNLARAAKDALSEVIPEAADVNRILGDLYTSRNKIAQASGRIENANVIPTRSLFGGAAGGWPGAIAAWLIDQPQLKPRLAYAIKQAKEGNMGKVEKVLQNTSDIRIAMALSERLTDEQLAELGLLE